MSIRIWAMRVDGNADPIRTQPFHEFHSVGVHEPDEGDIEDG